MATGGGVTGNPAITVVGMGPGSKEYLLPMGLAAIQQAEVLVGGKRHLEEYTHLAAEKLVITNNLKEVTDYIIANYQQKLIVVMVSGDPGFHSMLVYLRRYLPAEALKVIPGISSMQLAFARLAIPWQNAELISLHGHPISILNKYINKETVGVLADNNNTPQAIATFYYEQGLANNKNLTVCENLSYPQERIKCYQAAQLMEEKRKITNCVVIISNAC